MKTLLAAIVVLFATQAHAESMNCNNHLDGDSNMQINLNSKGELSLLAIGGGFTLQPSDYSSISSNSVLDNKEDSRVFTALNKTVTSYGDGEEFKENVSLIVVLNTRSKAARVTLIANGSTLSRNELYSVCEYSPAK
jgi:hypothetical protein